MDGSVGKGVDFKPGREAGLRLKLNTRIGAIFVVAIATLLIVLGVAWRAVDSAVHEAEEIRTRLGPVVSVTSQMLLAVEQMENAEFLYLGRDRGKWERHFDANAAHFERAAARIDKLVRPPENERRAAAIHRAYREFLVVDGQLRELLDGGKVEAARELNVRESLETAHKVRTTVRDLRSAGLQAIEDAQIHVEQTMQVAEWQVAGASLLGIVLGSVMWWSTTRIIVAPLAALRRATSALAAGRFDRLDHPEAGRTEEIAELQAEFNAMAARMETLTRDLAGAKASLEAEVASRTAELEQAKKRLEVSVDELKSVDKVKSDLMSVMSHELLTPINFVTAYATTLEDEALGPLSDPQKRAVRTILEGADRLARMVRNVLDYTRLEGGYAAILPELVDYPALLEDALAAMRPAAESRRIEVETDIPKALPGVWADPARAFQIVQELLDNAIKFSPEGGKVTVSVSADGDLVVTEIRDSGPGLSRGKSTKAFKPFYQEDSTSTRQHGGLGLGLAIVHRLIEAMGGTLVAQSAAGQGASFRFTLPVAGTLASFSGRPSVS